MEQFAFLYMQAHRNKSNTHIKKGMQVFEYKFNIKWSCEIQMQKTTIQIYIYYSIKLDGVWELAKLDNNKL